MPHSTQSEHLPHTHSLAAAVTISSCLHLLATLVCLMGSFCDGEQPLRWIGVQVHTANAYGCSPVLLKERARLVAQLQLAGLSVTGVVPDLASDFWPAAGLSSTITCHLYVLHAVNTVCIGYSRCCLRCVLIECGLMLSSTYINIVAC